VVRTKIPADALGRGLVKDYKGGAAVSQPAGVRPHPENIGKAHPAQGAAGGVKVALLQK